MVDESTGIELDKPSVEAVGRWTHSSFVVPPEDYCPSSGAVVVAEHVELN